MLNSKSIGNKIASARKKINLSQAELAQKVSISAQAVGKWERGESMPDIATLNHLAEIMGVDLNYFSDNFQSNTTEIPNAEQTKNELIVIPSQAITNDDNKELQWDMSKLSLVDSDFSGLKNLHEKFSSSNVQRCLFVGSNMSGLSMKNNNIDGCDFSNSDMSNCQIQSSNLDHNIYKNCTLRSTEFYKNNIGNCDFTDADFTKTTFKYGNFMKNILTNVLWKNTSFMEMQIQDVVFEGKMENCYFECSAFYNVVFQNAEIKNTFFKYNQKLNRVQFINCKVDNITYAFLKNGKADLTSISVLD